MKKLIVEIDEFTYSQIKMCVYSADGNLKMRNAIRRSKPLENEIEEIKAEIKASRILTTDRIIVDEILDNRIAELKGE